MKFSNVGVLSVALLSCSAFAQSIGVMPFDPVNGNFSARDVLDGVTATKSQCDKAQNAVWVNVNGETECIRYYPSNKYNPQNTKNVIVYFSGDLPVEVSNSAEYFASYSATTNLQSLLTSVDNMSMRIAMPAIQIARPGIMGSSGHHNTQRRRAIESQIMNQALTLIKQKVGFENPVLVGHSGGGHVAASITNYRKDIMCNVLVSSVSMPAARALAGGYVTYGLHEPKDELQTRSKTRYFMVGDKRDTVVNWDGQGQYARELRKKGISAENIVIKSDVNSEFHNLLEAGFYTASLCATQMPTTGIVKQIYSRYAF